MDTLTVVDNILAGADHFWQSAGYSSPVDYVETMHILGLLSEAEFHEALERLGLIQ